MCELQDSQLIGRFLVGSEGYPSMKHTVKMTDRFYYRNIRQGNEIRHFHCDFGGFIIITLDPI